MKALGLTQRAVHLDDLERAGPLVQAVHVLRDDGLDPALLLELGQRAVPVVRLHTRARVYPKCVELPDAGGVATECVDVRNLEGVVPLPDAARRPEVRDPRLGADAGAREHDAGLPPPHQLFETADAHVEILNPGWTVTPSRSRPGCVLRIPTPRASRTTPPTSSGSRSRALSTCASSRAATRRCEIRASRRWCSSRSAATASRRGSTTSSSSTRAASGSEAR